MKRTLSIETIEKVGKEVRVCGWVNGIRSHGKIMFIDLRDSGGLLQIVFSPKDSELLKQAEVLKPESVIAVLGKINKRPENMINA